MMKPTITEISTEIPDRFNLTGAELAAITQAFAYQAIRETKNVSHTETTESNIATVGRGIQNLSGFRPEANQIWRVLRDKAIERPISDFLWKVAHGVHKVILEEHTGIRGTRPLPPMRDNRGDGTHLI